MFLTLFVGIYDSRTRKLTYANAGHNPPYLISDRLRRLDDSKGVAIGVFEDEAYEEREIELKEGDTVFLYTDGVSEAVSGDRKFFGTDRLEQILEQKNREQCVASVLEGVRDFAQDTPQSDDITMLAFYVLPSFQIRVSAELKNLEAVQRLILEAECIAHDLRRKICLAVEELFVNICSYAYGSEQGSVEITMTISDRVFVRLRDSGRAFNPLENMADVENYDIDTQVGGLGRLIAFDLADQAYYEYSGNSNIITIIFSLIKEEPK